MRTSELAPRSGGFTLLEVLVAVAVLGLIYTVLAGVAIQGLRAEGESTRRLEASLVADRVLAELEVGMQEGTLPPPGRQEDEADGFLIVTEVTPFELPVELEGPEGAAAGSTLFGSRATPSSVRRVDVSVSWMEGAEELSVRRTSFGIDFEEAGPLLESLASEEQAS